MLSVYVCVHLNDLKLVSLSVCSIVSFSSHVSPHMSLHVCVFAICDDEPRLRTHCSDFRHPLQRCTWLDLYVHVCMYREQLFSSATWGGQREARSSYSCGPGACGNCGLNNVGDNTGGGERKDERNSAGKR